MDFFLLFAFFVENFKLNCKKRAGWCVYIYMAKHVDFTVFISIAHILNITKVDRIRKRF